MLPGTPAQLDDNDNLPCLRVVESDVMEFSWIHLTGRHRLDLGVCSPPCPPWSKAAASPPGLRRKDGALTPAAIAFMALLGCKVFCLENVSGLVQHEHWKVILEWLVFWGFDLRWAKCLDMAEIAPQKRERLIMIATRTGDASIGNHICVPWPTVGPPSLQQFDVLTQVSGHWLEECTPSEEVLRMYLDPSNLPKSGSGQRQLKKNKVDMMRYRLRSPQDQMSCVMANYGFGHELPGHTIQQGGLYGAILALPSGLRFCSTVEVALLQMPLGSCFLPAQRKEAIAILGNSISSVHAGIAILNAMAFLTDLTHVEICETFAKLVDSRLRASTLIIQEVAGGFMLSHSQIAATLPMHACEQLVLKSPVDEARLHIQVGLNICDVLRELMGASIPADIFLVPAGKLEHKVPLHPNLLMQQEQVTLFASVQTCLLMPTMMFGSLSDDSKFVVALCTFGTVIIARKVNMCVGDVLAFEFEQRPLFCTDILGFRLDHGDVCPDAVVVLSTPGIAPADFSGLINLEVESSGLTTAIRGFYADLAPFARLFQHTGILDMLMSMGWTLVVPVSAWEDDRFNVLQLMKSPNRLAIEATDVVYCVAIRIFISFLGIRDSVGPRPVIRVRIKFWSSWIWEGLWDPDSDFSTIRQIWKDVMLTFGLDWDIRFIIHGHNANFERPISQFLSPQDVHTGALTPGENPVEGAASGVKRKLPSPPPMPNIHDRPPTPPSVPGTPPQPPTPPLPPRLRTAPLSPAENESESSESSESAPDDRHVASSFREVFDLVHDNFERALMVALDNWVKTQGVDWDVEMTGVAELRMSLEGHLIFWDGTFSVLLRLIHILQLSKLDVVMAKMGWIVTVQFLEFANPVRGRVLLIPHTEG